MIRFVYNLYTLSLISQFLVNIRDFILNLSKADIFHRQLIISPISRFISPASINVNSNSFSLKFYFYIKEIRYIIYISLFALFHHSYLATSIRRIMILRPVSLTFIPRYIFYRFAILYMRFPARWSSPCQVLGRHAYQHLPDKSDDVTKSSWPDAYRRSSRNGSSLSQAVVYVAF